MGCGISKDLWVREPLNFDPWTVVLHKGWGQRGWAKVAPPELHSMSIVKYKKSAIWRGKKELKEVQCVVLSGQLLFWHFNGIILLTNVTIRHVPLGRSGHVNCVVWIFWINKEKFTFFLISHWPLVMGVALPLITAQENPGKIHLPSQYISLQGADLACCFFHSLSGCNQMCCHCAEKKKETMKHSHK